MAQSPKLFDSSKGILVMGDVMLDGYASGDVERISPEAPVPVMRHLAHQEVPGGSANVAMNIVALGGRVSLVGMIGEDDEGGRLAGMLTAAGIEDRLVRVAGRSTTFKLRILAGKHQMLRIDKETTEDAPSEIEDELIAAAIECLGNAKALILSDYRKGCLTDKVIRTVIGAARDHRVPVFIDPKRNDFAIYEGARFITPNRTELKAATGIACVDNDASRRAARTVIASTNASILLTLSEQGMVLFSPEGEEIRLPTDAQEVFDVSGAGDSVIAAFAYAIVSGMPTARALRIANCTAGIVIGKAGTATATEAEVVEALEREHYRPTGKAGAATLQEAIRVRAKWKDEKLLVGFTNGCFDLLHPGHIKLLQEAAQRCDRLIVALNSDASVQRLKGPARPIQTENARVEVIAAIRHVDMVILFEEDTPLDTVRALEPDLLIKGSDYQEHEIIGADVVRAAGGEVVRVNLEQGHSTTNLVRRSMSVS